MNTPVFEPAVGAVRLDTVNTNIALTNTGLDALVQFALIDPGLNQQIEDADIVAGARAAAEMNTIVIAGIKATGIANDDKITADDVYVLSDWIAANRRTDWIRAHGDDEEGVETGFHKIQGDGNALHMFGDKLIDQVADGIYHLGFGYKNGSLINEDGNGNARVEEVAYWLDELLADDLAAGTLRNGAVSSEHEGTTGTGLDQLVELINDDPGLERRLPASEIKAGAEAADVMNGIIIEGIKALGLADDGTLDPSEVYRLTSWIKNNRSDAWLTAHGDDEDDEETAFHLVQNDGSETRMFGRDGVDTIADAIYHLGFGYKDGRLINEDGNKNERVEDVTYWLNQLLADDLANGSLATGKGTPVAGTTGTGLDNLVGIISGESELNRRISEYEINKGAQAADAMNQIIVDGIKATGIANDGKITQADVKDLANWIEANHKTAWITAHGDDENNTETGFHLVQADGAKERLYDQNAVDTIADGLYHVGFGYDSGRVINEDGDKNASLTDVAFWLEALLVDDLADGSLNNGSIDLYPEGTTGTALDEMTQAITADPGLTDRYTASELKKIAEQVDDMNAILVDALTETGVANDGSLTATDLAVVGKWIEDNAQSRWATLRGNEDKDVSVMGLVWNGGVTELGTVNAFNELGRAMYSLGFGSQHGGIRDQNGDWKGSLEDVASWMNAYLADDLLAASFYNAAQEPVNPSAFSGDLIDSVAAVAVRDDDNYAVIDDRSALRMDEGTFTFTFTANEPEKNNQVLFAKDGKGSNDGDMRMYLHDGKLHVKVSMDGKDHFLKIEETIKVGQPHDVAVSFDGGAISVWFDGIRHVYRDDFDYDMRTNTSDIIVGASNGNQEGNEENINAEFQGQIVGFSVYDKVLEQGEVQGLSQGTRKNGNGSDNNIAGTDGDDAIYGGLGRDAIKAGGGDDIVDGGYDSDTIDGGAGNDIIFAGEGQDSVNGGDGDDIIIVESDGREPQIGQLIYGSNGRVRDDNGWVDYTTLTIYPEQPIPADDVLIGGDGADTFRFQWNINAKDYIIEKHTREDGSINWAGVAGENTYLHDHWVDTIGNDRILDFDKSEGDRIEVAGHTLTFDGITYTDVDGDGTDESIIAYKSNQGNGGAHDQDKLGTITVFGDRVVKEDIYQIPSMTVHYGVVENIADLDEAITPLSIDAGYSRSMPASLTPSSIDGPRGDDIDGTVAKADGAPKAATRSNTGLDTILDWIETDPGLLDRISTAEINQGSAAAAEMNKILIEAIKATGAANDGVIDAGDVYDIADWIEGNRKTAWLKHHGNDEDGVETAFHLVQNDGAQRDAYGRNSINTIADAIYHLGFGYKDDRLINEDGNKNERVESVAFWLNDLLKEDLAGSSLKNASATKDVSGTTGTGLDQIVDIIQEDSELGRRISDSDQQKGAKAADVMNKIIVEHIKKLGLANDGVITAADVMQLAESIRKEDYDTWVVYHGDDDGSKETGFHRVQNDGAITQLFGQNAVNTIADGLYHLGFGYNKNKRLINEDGDGNASVESVAHWLNQLLADDMDGLSNSRVDPSKDGSTGTGLDKLVDIINTDAGLQRKVSLTEIQSGASGADVMNEIIVQSIKATGVANNGRITASDVATLAEFIQKNHAEMWAWAHGDDEDNVETTFHRVKSDGGEARLYGHAAIDTIADGIYHLGFGHNNGRLINEDGKANASLSDVAFWLEDLLADELASGRLGNANTGPYQSGTTGTGLDALVEMVATDEGLLSQVSTTELSKAARAADGLNKILLKAIQATGVANDGQISDHDIKLMDAWIAANQKDLLDRYNGTEEDGNRTGFEIAELWSSKSPLFGENGVNTVADSLYSIGYGTKYNNAIANRDDKWQAELVDVAAWLEALLEGDLANGSLFVGSQAYADPSTFEDDIVYAAPRDVVGNGQGGYVNVKHTNAMALDAATVSFNFTANSLPDDKGMTLFSKDGKGNGDGHTELYFYNGELHVRMQTAEKSHYLKVAERGALQTGATYAIAMILGDKGLQVFINGEQAASNLELDMSWEGNGEDIVIGGSGNARQPGQVDPIHSGFDGVITDFTIYDRALNFGEIGGLAGVNTDITPSSNATVPDLTPPADPVEQEQGPETEPEETAETPVQESNVEEIMSEANNANTLGTQGGAVTGSAGTDVYVALAGENDLDGAAGNDLLVGGFQDDTLEGGAGNDALVGDLEGAIFGGDDLLIGGTGDDMLKGGKGADIFGFSTNDGDDIIADFGLNFTDVGSDNGFKTTPTGADFEVGIDKIQLTGFSTVNDGNVLTSGALSQTADGALFEAEGTTILLFGVNLNTLSENDFAFA